MAKAVYERERFLLPRLCVGRPRAQSPHGLHGRRRRVGASAKPVATYSIAACDLEAGQWGVATQSKFLAVGSVVPWAEPGVGAIATQAYANPRYGPEGLALLREGLSAEEVVERLTSADDGAYLGEATGLVLGFENGTTIYFAGDTCVFGDMQLIGRIYSPDVAVLPIGGHFTMDPREAAVALELLGAKRCIPCHYGTFPLLAGTPEELRGQARDVEVIALEPGETTTV